MNSLDVPLCHRFEKLCDIFCCPSGRIVEFSHVARQLAASKLVFDSGSPT